MNYVILRLNEGIEVVGGVLSESDRGLELHNAMAIKYKYDHNTGRPVIWLSKYCVFAESYNVFYETKEINHIFRDLLPEFTNFYIKTVDRLTRKETNIDLSNSLDDSIYNDTESNANAEAVLRAFDELMSGNTSIQ